MSLPFPLPPAWVLIVGTYTLPPGLDAASVMGVYSTHAQCERAMTALMRLNNPHRRDHLYQCFPRADFERTYPELRLTRALDGKVPGAENPLCSDTYGLSSLVHEQSPGHCASRPGFLFSGVTE